MEKVKVAFLSTYPPKICGIGSYTRDLIKELKNLKEIQSCQIIALDSSQEKFIYPSEVLHQFNKDSLDDYKKVAELLNCSEIDIVSLQHEYGLYGGQMGNFILEFLKKLQKPLITTIHMILSRPIENQKKIIEKLAHHSRSLVIMTQKSKADLIKEYRIESQKIKIIPHGAPDLPFGQTEIFKKRLGFAGRRVLTSVNIIRFSRGVDLVLESLPAIIKKFPKTVYLIIGPDPSEIRGSNLYRQKLINFVQKAKLEKHVFFKNEYLPLKKLMEHLQATDIFLTPYRPPKQSSSGSLAYAVAAGKVCVSTPFNYAREVLADDRGVIVPWENHREIAKAVIRLLSHPEDMERIAHKTYTYGRKMTWEKVARKYLSVFTQCPEGNEKN
jgi:glycosyltransferase involved in cell wall biosynthesis